MQSSARCGCRMVGVESLRALGTVRVIQGGSGSSTAPFAFRWTPGGDIKGCLRAYDQSTIFVLRGAARSI